MIPTLLVIGVLSFAPSAEAPKVAQQPQLPFTEICAAGGRVVVRGKEFEATAQRVRVSADGKCLELCGSDSEPACLISRPKDARARTEVTGTRIIYSPSDGTMQVTGSGILRTSVTKEK
ncbi:unnamed protein product [Gemmata massiliana]|uniref:Uncharacterized protein n=1 Tax=Gemmata massiliana TaxID=1210884 RepID=A0A6P2CXZ8_9BACT|nr:hypothetical protein [Gemmata massiliana]VTR92985.1 unnamed protein product [Gemmata massiliana]